MTRRRKQTTDAVFNTSSHLGYGSGNLLDGIGYNSLNITNNRQLLENMYRTSWVCGMAIDLPADDMTREGVDITSDMKPEDAEVIYDTMATLSIWENIAKTIKWSRLYGGAGALIMIDGADYTKPLDLSRIRRGSFKGIIPLDRHMLLPDMSKPIKDICPDMGLPEFYDIHASGNILGGRRVHHSRILRFTGIEMPYYQQIQLNSWGISELERAYDRLIAYDNATTGTAQLMHKAHLRVVKFQKLAEKVGTGGAGADVLMKRLDKIRYFQSIEGLTVLDKEDEFEAHNYTFTGIPDVLLQLAQQLSGAFQIPLVKLLGQSPAGLNATGESDIRNYYDKIKAGQKSKLFHPVKNILTLCAASELGVYEDNIKFTFKPLWQMSDKEKSEIADTTTKAVSTALGGGIICAEEAKAELKQSSHVTGIYTNLK